MKPKEAEPVKPQASTAPVTAAAPVIATSEETKDDGEK